MKEMETEEMDQVETIPVLQSLLQEKKSSNGRFI